jgi:ADP-ribose pyrophosphatase
MPESEAPPLPPFPGIRLELVEDVSPDGGRGYLRLVRRKLRAHYPDGTVSAPFLYDEVDRKALDATVVAAHFTRGQERRVYLRSALRPPVYYRDAARSPVPFAERPEGRGGLWELPAGLIEPDERGPEGLLRSAARELGEETGFVVPPASLRPLGPSTYPAPGVIGERHFFFEVEVDPGARAEPSLDGSALERDGVVVDVALGDALAWCASGEIEDAKTELALRRLRERYP